MLSLDLTHQSKDFLEKLDSKQFRQIVKKVLSLMENPKPPDARPLKGHHFWRADISEYRIIYRVQNNCLKVALIDKRNDGEVYKLLNRRA